MNVASPQWASFFPEAANPLTSVLANLYDVPRDMPQDFRTLVQRIDRPRRTRR